MHTIALIEDEDIIRNTLKRLLERNQYQVSEAANITQAKSLKLSQYDLVLSDLRLPDGQGTDLIALAGGTPVLIMTSYASMRSAVDAMKLGAAEYIAKPFDHQEMLDTIARLIKDNPRLPAEEFSKAAPEFEQQIAKLNSRIIGSSSVMQRIYQRLEKVAPNDITCLIHGESGTGKELIAKAIHELSPRGQGPLISVNCAAIPESLIEAELFGHEKGAFTGAGNTRQGLIEAANGGTLFLDEIGELPLEAQARLLRVLQEREIRRVGSVQAIKVDIRLVAATHRNLRQLVESHRFREDLYYRLQVIEIALPALREREQDVLEIAEFLLRKHADKMPQQQSYHFSQAAKRAMLNYSWPGNVRELENAVQRALILCEEGDISPELLGIHTEPAKVVTASTASPIENRSAEANRETASLDQYFTQFVLEHQGQLSETELAKRLGISRKCLWERRQRYGIPRSKKKST